ncbi:AraC family transcriptional regulator [Saccharothrix sp. ALI-22-I]|uniref:helix-turn-helix domain-containing protein n=1 Tax=Saccharothrix sp. ALI-22-I TaxID=1933778 RepID=UPI00097C5089|nr:helix-turn-helix domain-containing protein [Saccharothrix sp. ALI-22-I]ONI87678.1 AraC family transcriptional regulator [Saccharothrix sp. ALI-22-I]
MEQVTVRLDVPPVVVNLGVGVHGVGNRRDEFLLPELWQLHLYGYTAELTVGGTTHPIRQGHVSLVPPGAQVSYRYRGRSEHLYAHLRLPGKGEALTVPVMQDAGADTPLLAGLLRHAIAVAPSVPAMAAAEVWTVLWRVARLTASGKPHSAVGAAIAHIEANVSEPLAVPDIAAAAGVSHNHLTRLFRAETGDTVVAYIRRRRLERARHLLRESTLPIPAVAAAVGFTDLQSFNKACRRELGAPPRAVRAGVRHVTTDTRPSRSR